MGDKYKKRKVKEYKKLWSQVSGQVMALSPVQFIPKEPNFKEFLDEVNSEKEMDAFVFNRIFYALDNLVKKIADYNYKYTKALIAIEGYDHIDFHIKSVLSYPLPSILAHIHNKKAEYERYVNTNL